MDAYTDDKKPHILVVDDDPAITELIASVLEDAGLEATVCHNGEDALRTLAEGSFDLALLDIMMPGMDGLELCSRIKERYDLPVVFLTARDGESDLVVSFTLGADDYIVKPFRPRELVARVKARLRRPAASQQAQEEPGVLHTRDFDIDVAGHDARLRGERLELTRKEFAVLVALAERPGTPVSTRELFERVWEAPFDASASNTVMVHIRRLRKKCAEIDSSQPFIDTVWGVGYRLHGEKGDDR